MSNKNRHSKFDVAGSNPVMPDNDRLNATSKEKRERLLAEILSIIKKNPGIRPSNINRMIKREHSANLRLILIKRKLVKKIRKGAAVHYYPA